MNSAAIFIAILSGDHYTGIVASGLCNVSVTITSWNSDEYSLDADQTI